jgi:uncharacterized Fe-S cluster protein YjdI/CDGSH-type Zn-finger protein
MRKTHRGPEIEVSYDLERCIHIAECLRGLPAVFDRNRQPWLLPDAASADAIVDVVERCPSGALQYRRLDGGADEEHEGTTVTPILNGPLCVVGEIRVLGEDGTEELVPRATLCRCGRSARTPYCDGSHMAAGFEAPGEPFRTYLGRV